MGQARQRAAGHGGRRRRSAQRAPLHAGRVRAAVRQVLYRPRYRAAAQQLAGILRDAPGPSGAAELLESLAGEDRIATEARRRQRRREVTVLAPRPTPPRPARSVRCSRPSGRDPHAGPGFCPTWAVGDGRGGGCRPTALRVLDVGCAFGYGSAAVAVRGPAGRVVIGLERDPEHLELGHSRFPWLRIIDADATALPVADGCADAVMLLDVIEHIAEREQVLSEAHRVLRPGGVLVLSVPHAGPLRWLDALNLYQAARRKRPSLPPLEAATESDGGPHEHFTAAELKSLLAPGSPSIASRGPGLGYRS